MDDHMELCDACNGSGEGPADGTRCHECKGLGEVPVERVRDPFDYDFDGTEECFRRR